MTAGLVFLFDVVILQQRISIGVYGLYCPYLNVNT